MTKLTRKITLDLQYAWKNILGMPSGKKYRRIYFDQPVRVISNMKYGMKHRNDKGISFKIVPKGFDLTEAIKRLPKLFNSGGRGKE